jgi:DNA-binding winged helix-turn-helix (wHTH) protein
MNHTDVDGDTFSNWLTMVKLRDNPFQDYSAQKDSDLSSYFVSVGSLRLADLVKDLQPWAVFGERGSGKTSLRRMIAVRCRPTNPLSDVLVLECDWQTLDKMLRKAGGLTALTSEHWVETLVELAIPLLSEDQRPRWMSRLLSARAGVVFLAYAHEDRSYVDELAERLEKAGIAVWYDRKLHKGRRWCKELEERIQNARAMIPVLSWRSRGSEWMEREVLFAMDHNVPVIPFLLEKVDLPLWAVGFQCARNTEELIRTLRGTGRLRGSPGPESLDELASAAGVHLVICLVDEVDEVPGLQDQSSVVQLLSCLMDPRLHSVKGVAFRYFLPAWLKDALIRKGLRLDRYRIGDLRWDPEGLKRLIRQRMIAFSESKAAPYQSLGELCDPSGGFAARIDDELASLAEGNPRAAVCLADQLLRSHCREDPPLRLIRQTTWEDVKEWWRQEGRDWILGQPVVGLPFHLQGDRIFFQNREVILSSRYHALLCCLVRAGGSVCSTEELARAGWPEDDPSGVTPRAIDEAVRRMKRKLQEQGIDPQWVQTVRGRGYRILSQLNEY